MNTRTLILERFIEMLDERGLSSHQYKKDRDDYRVDHMIDISKDGEWLARYNIAFLHRFSEGDMSKELDKLKGQFMQQKIAEFMANLLSAGIDRAEVAEMGYAYALTMRGDELKASELVRDAMPEADKMHHERCMVNPDQLVLQKEVKVVRAEMIEVDRDAVNEYWKDL